MLLTRSLIAFAAALVLMALAGCGKPEAQAAAESKPPESKPAAAAPVSAATSIVTFDPQAPELKEMSMEPLRAIPIPADAISAPARIEVNPNRIAHTLVPVPGRIARVMARLGDSVTQGQPVVSIESPAIADAEANFAASESALKQAQSSATKADADLARVTDLFQHQAAPQKDVLAAQTAASLAKSSVQQAESARQQARRRLEGLGLKPGGSQQHVTVNAPLSGKVLEISVVEGEYRNEINTPLMTIADLSRVWATSEVAESAIRYVKPGAIAEMELIAYPGESFRARVTRIADTVNSETRTIKVSAELENPGGKLRPEMFGKMRFTRGEAPTLWAPEGAVVRSGDKDFIFVEEAPGRFRASEVQLGKHFGAGFAITGGVKSGDRIVTRGSIYLKAAL